MKMLYRVINGKMLKTKIVKETPCYYWIDDPTFHHLTQFRKGHDDGVYTTKKLAWAAEYKRIESDISGLLYNLSICKKSLKIIERLIKAE